ncbi:T9SS type A sorting domain-containing protein [Melioribacteraceae bacterium 4301-Me]|uniref:T9SS type A sorting domain-containing protein n=1 Tax=Pyranulibacter aquaticus TaxID=3163344 RepID=UPI0035984054
MSKQNSMMQRLLLKAFLSLLLFANLLFAQNYPFYFSVDCPKFIPENKNFDISITSRFYNKFADVNFFLFTESNIVIEEATLKAVDFEKKIKAKESGLNKDGWKAYKIKLPLDDPQFKVLNPFQVEVTLNPNYNSEGNINFAVETKTLKNNAKPVSAYYGNLSLVKFETYTPQLVSGRSLLLKENSKFSFKINDKNTIKNILTEFWVKFSSPVQDFITIENSAEGDTLLSLSNNKFYIASVKDLPDLKIFNQAFLGRNTWSHVTIRLTPMSKTAEIWINDILVFSYSIKKEFSVNDLIFTFSGSLNSSPYQIDLLKVWDFNNSVYRSFDNKNYLSYYADSSRILFSMNFDNYSQINSSSPLVDVSNVMLLSSDAPIFSRVPVLNLTSFDNYNLIQWHAQDVKNVGTYVIEKATKGNQFDEVYSIDADEDQSKIYSYTDFKNYGDDVVSYRLKQLNKDGTVSYSSVVKIGQGEKKPFIIDQNYPNPFNPVTTIIIDIIEPTDIKITVYDLVGKEIEELYSGYLQSGKYNFTFDGSKLPSGIYFYEVKTPRFSEVRKMILAK